MSNGQELVLHKKLFRQLTTDELYELLRVRSEVFVLRHRSMPRDSMKVWGSNNHPTPSCSTVFHISR